MIVLLAGIYVWIIVWCTFHVGPLYYLGAGSVRGASLLTAVILIIPQSPSLAAVVLSTLQSSLTVLISLTISLTLATSPGGLGATAALPAPADLGQGVNDPGVHHDGHCSVPRAGVLQEGHQAHVTQVGAVVIFKCIALTIN